MQFSVVIASHNEGAALGNTVASTVASIGEADYEIVVVDDGSTDESVAAVRSKFPAIIVVDQVGLHGTAPAKNTGAQTARGETLVFLDAHCKPEQEAIVRLVRAVEELNGEAIVTPCCTALDAGRWIAKHDQRGFCYGVDLKTLDTSWIDPADARRAGRFLESPTLMGCACAMSRQLYEALGGFDSDQEAYGCEDFDLGLRAWMLGHPVLNDPEAVVAHRFAEQLSNPAVQVPHNLANQVRLARRIFSTETWDEWIAGFVVENASSWPLVSRLYQKSAASAEAQRQIMLGKRRRDEFGYAEYFGLRWPRRAKVFSPEETMMTEQIAAPTTAAEPERAGEQVPIDALVRESVARYQQRLRRDHAERPYHNERMEDASTVGCARVGECMVRIYLKLIRPAPQRIEVERAAFESEGSADVQFLASVLTSQVESESLSTIAGWQTERLVEWVGDERGLIEPASLAIAALRDALGRI